MCCRCGLRGGGRIVAVRRLLACVVVLAVGFVSGCKKAPRDVPPPKESDPGPAPSGTKRDKVAELAEALKAQGTRTDALIALDKMGSAAAPAVPALMELLKTVKQIRSRGHIVKVLA